MWISRPEDLGPPSDGREGRKSRLGYVLTLSAVVLPLMESPRVLSAFGGCV
jgi:hypothetical protein